MKISVITPSYNQAQFLPSNLESVKSQQHTDIEHIVVDPGSTDASTDIARQDPDITLIAEPDRGQSDGICKGFTQCSGDILVWLNSDDYYPDNYVLSSVLKCFKENPEVDIVYGDVNFVDENGEFIRKGFVNKNSEQLLSSFEYQVGIVQPGVFWRRRVFEEIGGPSEEFEYCMDYELWVRMASKGYKWKYIPKVLAHHRWWDGMKTSSRRDLSFREHFKVCNRYFGYVHWKWLDRFAEYLCSKQDGIVNHATSINLKEKNAATKRAIDEIITQEMLYKLAQTVEDEQIATRQYIENNYPELKRIYFGSEELNIISEVSDDPKAQQRVAWNIFTSKTIDQNFLSAYHVPNNFDRYFDKSWHKEQLNRAEHAIEKLHTEKRGDICIIVGNGPSLRDTDLSLLKNVDTIVSNFAALSSDLIQYSKILTVVNDLVAKQGAIDFNSNALTKFVPFWLANHFNLDDHTFFVNATVRPEFSKNFVHSASWRSTVSFFNMQLAYAIGYKKVILIGFDHSYVQPKGVVEGTVINQIEDDENHFDPRYFKGKDWQAADTVNMEKMYAVAKSAFEEDGRKIVNCTSGGKLELFTRGDLATELDLIDSVRGDLSLSNADNKKFPRLLMIDSTPVGHDSATGRLKQTFLADWPVSSFLQIWKKAGSNSEFYTFRLDQTIKNSKENFLTFNSLIDKCKAFEPDVIYFRPIDSSTFFDVAEKIYTTFNKPLIIHMMDDWPERLRLENTKKYNHLDKRLRNLIKYANKHLSISQKMSDVYNIRYGSHWTSLANGADIVEFRYKNSDRKHTLKTKPFIVRYMGALANDMTFTSVSEVAKVISSMHFEYSVCLEIYTMEWCKLKAEQELGILPGISIHNLVDTKEYNKYICEADSLLIAYNFDSKSLSYMSLSLANKMPECLASGAPLLAYGPIEAATIDFLKTTNCVQVVSERDPELLQNAIKQLILQPDYCQNLGKKARQFVAKNLSKQNVQKDFYNIIIKTKHSIPIKNIPLIGPFDRSRAAHYDETDCIAQLYSNVLKGNIMVDVGAHHGWALLPFLNNDWTIYAFEPDNKNRIKLLDLIAKHKNKKRVNVDIRCVSNKSQKNLSFYCSEQSTGISGLSAFHKTHTEAQRVDTTTLSEFFGSKPLPKVDFLKIDTEGHDLFVLQGFPWNRTKPAIIECEYEDIKTIPLGYTFHDLADFLINKGYIVYVSEWHPIIRYGIRHNWKQLVKYPCQLSNTNAWGNLLAFRDSIDEKDLTYAVHKVLKFDDSISKQDKTNVIDVPLLKKGIHFSRLINNSHFINLSNNQWQYKYSNSKQKFWIALFNTASTEGRTYIATIKLKSSKEMTMSVSLGRQGNCEYEGKAITIKLMPNEVKNIRIYKKFTKPHSMLKIQINVLHIKEATTGILEISSFSIIESIESAQKFIHQKDLILAKANALFREGDYSTAMSYYLLMNKKQQLSSIYSNNALMAARRLGINTAGSIEKLLKYVSA